MLQQIPSRRSSDISLPKQEQHYLHSQGVWCPLLPHKVKALDLPKRALLFEPSNEAITIITHAVNVETIVITVENDTSARVVLQKHTRLGSIIDTEINGFFATPESNAKFAATGQNKSKKQLMLKGLLAVIAAWHVLNATTAELPITPERNLLAEAFRKPITRHNFRTLS